MTVSVELKQQKRIPPHISIPLNQPPTQSLSAGLSYSLLVRIMGAGGQRTMHWRPCGDQEELIVVVGLKGF